MLIFSGFVVSVAVQPESRAEYTEHDPIVIDGNDDFTRANGVVSGDGTRSDPYIIEGWSINSTEGAGIDIRNTDANFIIKNIRVHANRYSYDTRGIYLYNVANGKIQDTVIEYQMKGIHVHNSSKIIIIKNEFRDDYEAGIKLENSNLNIMDRNELSGVGWFAIQLDNSSSNRITGNIVRNSEYFSNYRFSILNYRSTNNTISGNYLDSGGIALWGSELIHYNTHNITSNNTMDYKPIHYWKNRNNGTIPEGAGQVILANCSNVFIEYQDFVRSSVGVLLGYSKNITVTDTIFKNNWDGISMESSQNCIIEDNIFEDNDYGIWMEGSWSNDIRDNIFESNYYGSNLKNSDHNHIYNNNITMNAAGIVLEQGNNNRISSNSITLSEGSGIIQRECANNTISGNAISDNLHAFSIHSTINTTISENTMKGNGFYQTGDLVEHWNTHSIGDSNTIDGKPVLYLKNAKNGVITTGPGQIILGNCENIEIADLDIKQGFFDITSGFSSRITISNNTANPDLDASINFYNSHDCAIINNRNIRIGFTSSDRNTISNNLFFDTRDECIGLFRSSNNSIIDNEFNSMLLTGIKVILSYHNSMIDNLFIDGSSGAVELERSDLNTIRDNNITNSGGISLTESNKNSIGNNLVDAGSGISVSYSDNNMLDHNEITNGRIGISLYVASNNTISDNKLYNNTLDGLHLSGASNHNRIVNNNITLNKYGIEIMDSRSNNISNNYIDLNENIGISLKSESYENTIKENTIARSDYGILLTYGYRDMGTSVFEFKIYPRDNLIYNNDFFYNGFHVLYDEIHSSFVNIWNYTYPTGGNYWSDYDGKDKYSGPGQDLAGSDGIGDTPYVVNGSRMDHYPLMEPAGDIVIPEPYYDDNIDDGTDDEKLIPAGTWYALGMALLMILVLIALLVRKKKKAEGEGYEPLRPMGEGNKKD